MAARRPRYGLKWEVLIPSVACCVVWPVFVYSRVASWQSLPPWEQALLIVGSVIWLFLCQVLYNLLFLMAQRRWRIARPIRKVLTFILNVLTLFIFQPNQPSKSRKITEEPAPEVGPPPSQETEVRPRRIWPLYVGLTSWFLGWPFLGYEIFQHTEPGDMWRFSLFVGGSLVWLLIVYVNGYNLVLFLYNAIRQRSPLLADILYGLWQTIRLVFRLARSMAGQHHSGT